MILTILSLLVGESADNGAHFFGYMGIAAALVFCSKYKRKKLRPIDRICGHIKKGSSVRKQVEERTISRKLR